MTRYKVIVPDAITWEFDEIVAGGQNDRYAMTITLAPYGTLINDPKLSKTAGNGPGPWLPAIIRSPKARFRRWLDLRRAKDSKNQEWAFEFIQMACSKQWMQRSLERGNAPPRVSVLNQPAVRRNFGWAPVLAETMKTAKLEPRDPIWPRLDCNCGRDLRRAIGQKMKVALDGRADWRRTLRRAPEASARPETSGTEMMTRIDCDIHPGVPDIKGLLPYMSDFWRTRSSIAASTAST